MANCKVCNAPVPDGTDMCDDCKKRLAQNDEQYLDQLLASVTRQESSKDNVPYHDAEDPLLNTDNTYIPNNEFVYSEEELEKQSSTDDDWNLLNETITKQTSTDSGYIDSQKGIPAEGALDEVDSILDNYDNVLEEMSSNQDDSENIDIEQEEEPDQLDIINSMMSNGLLDNEDDIVSIPDALIAEDMQNPLVDHDIINSLDDVSSLYTAADSVVMPDIVNEEPLIQESEFVTEGIDTDMDALLASLDGDTEGTQEVEAETIEAETIEAEPIDIPDINMEPVTDTVEEPAMKIIEDPEPMETIEEPELMESIEEPTLESIPEPDPIEEITSSVPDDELSELDKLLGEVTENVDDFNIDNIMSTDTVAEGPDSNSKSVAASDVLSQSLSAVSGLDDPSLEEQFNSILPKETLKEEKKKVSFFKRLFGNIPPENPEAEFEQLAKDEALEEEKKQKKQEEKQLKQAKKEEDKAKKVAAKEEKQKNQAEAKERQKKARDAIAAAYVPAGKINKAGALVVFALAACLAFVIIQGTKYASYHLSIKSAEKDFQNSRYDEAYESLSGESLNDSDSEMYDKVQTIMVVKKELNSYYNFKKMNMELEALDSLIKGIDRYERYITNAQRLKVDGELNILKQEMLTILITQYNLSENEAVGLVNIEHAIEYTNELTNIVNSNVALEAEDSRLVQQNK